MPQRRQQHLFRPWSCSQGPGLQVDFAAADLRGGPSITITSWERCFQHHRTLSVGEGGHDLGLGASGGTEASPPSGSSHGSPLCVGRLGGNQKDFRLRLVSFFLSQVYFFSLLGAKLRRSVLVFVRSSHGSNGVRENKHPPPETDLLRQPCTSVSRAQPHSVTLDKLQTNS